MSDSIYKFNVGDRVKIVNYEDKVDEESFIGKTGTIILPPIGRDITYTVDMDDVEWAKKWSALGGTVLFLLQSEIEFIEKKFKVGDRVKLNPESEIGTNVFNGPGTILKTETNYGEYDYTVQFDKNPIFMFGFFEDELIPSPEEAAVFEVGDRVTLVISEAEGEEACWLRPVNGWQATVTGTVDDDEEFYWVAIHDWNKADIPSLEKFRGVIGIHGTELKRAAEI